MTREDILKMEAGREMDALIAEKVMEWTAISKITPGISLDLIGTPPQGRPDLVPHFSTDISAAWEVVKEMSAKNYWCIMEIMSSRCYTMFEEVKTKDKYQAEANVYELPLAICRAALLTTLQE